MIVLYTVVGEVEESVDENKPREPDRNFNAFVMDGNASSSSYVRLEDIQRVFPLGYNFHFAFRHENGSYLDLVHPDARVPFCGRNIIARVTPLVNAPEIRFDEAETKSQHNKQSLQQQQQQQQDRLGHHEMPAAQVPISAPSSSSSFQSGPRHHPEEEPEWQADFGSQHTPSRHQEEEDDDEEEQDWRQSQRHHERDRDMERERDEYGHERMGDHRSSGASSSAAEWGTGKDFFRKQKDQALEFAKNMSMEDAKKGATETAKKAKKWLSSISATISSAASATLKVDSLQIGKFNLNVIRPLADGAYGQVLLVRSSPSNELFALKRVICQSAETERDVQKELEVLHKVRHQNIVQLVEFAETRHQNLEFNFLFPFYERGNLWNAIESARDSSSPLWPFTQFTALHLFHGICSGSLALHRAGFCHRDLKPHNVLLACPANAGEDFLAYVPILTDFGSCAPIAMEIRTRKMSMDVQDEANRKSSAPYRAPELFEPSVETTLDGQSDVWSLGCLLYAMAFGTSPFEHPKEGFMKLACMNGRVSFPAEKNGAVYHRNASFSLEFCDFIRDMLHVVPDERPTLPDVLDFTAELLNDHK